MKIDVGGSLDISDTGSIRSEAFSGDGAGGPITITSPKIMVNESAQILSSNIGANAGGTIDIDTGELVLMNRGKVESKSSGAGPLTGVHG